MNIYHLFFFFLSTRYLTLFLCLGHSCSMCLITRGPDKLRHPPGLECKGEEAEEQKQWGQCSRHRAATAHGALRDLSVGGLAGALDSMMLLPNFVSVASTSLTSFLLTSDPRSPSFP